MFSLISSIKTHFGNLTCDYQTSVFLTGVDNSGSSSILNWFQSKGEQPLKLTSDFKVEKIIHNRVEFTFCEGKSNSNHWLDYLNSCDNIAVVIDANDKGALGKSKQKLFDILKQKQNQNFLLLIYANKQDLPNSLSKVELIEELDLNSIERVNWHVQTCSALSGEGLYEGLEWMIMELFTSE